MYCAIASCAILSACPDTIAQYISGEVPSQTGKQKKAEGKRLLIKEAKASADPLESGLTKATSNEQKRLVFKANFDRFGTEKELVDYLKSTARKKLISIEFAPKILKDYRDAA